jgi:hypothetical protein
MAAHRAGLTQRGARRQAPAVNGPAGAAATVAVVGVTGSVLLVAAVTVSAVP